MKVTVARGASKTRSSTSLVTVGFIVAVPVLIFAYLLSQPQADQSTVRRTVTVYRYERPVNVSWGVPSNLNQILSAIRKAHGDASISRLVTMNGRPIRKPTSIPEQLIALDATEHFYWPFVAEHFAHDLSKLHLDRDVRLISRSSSPRVFEIEGFLSHEECDEIVRLGLAAGLEASPLILSEQEKKYDWSRKDFFDHFSVGDLDSVLADARTSTGVFIEHWTKPMLQRISERASNLTRVPPRYSEQIQIIHYNKKQHYWAHYDWIDPSVPVDSWPARARGGVDNRYLTILFYLNDVAKGGYTTFPRSNPEWTENVGYNAAICAESFESLRIYPKKGNAVLFYNVLPDGQKAGIKDPMSLHAGCDPVDSEKWAANFWLHLAPMRSFDAPQTYCVGEHCSP